MHHPILGREGGKAETEESNRKGKHGGEYQDSSDTDTTSIALQVAKIHAENAIRQKNQSLNYLRMSAR